jgi:hypothetical protein
VRVQVKEWADCQRPKAGYRRKNTACSVQVVLMEVDTTQLPLPRMPCPMTAAQCPLCGELLSLGGYYEIVELVPVDVQPRQKPSPR